MSTPSSNTPSSPSSFATSANIGRSGSSRSLFRDSIAGGAFGAVPGSGRKSNRSRQNTIGGDSWLTDESRNLSSEYQEIQKRTLTKWVNAQLCAVNDRIDNIETDLRDGKRLLKLLSVVSQQPAPKPEKMNMRIHQLANVAQALGFLEKQLGAEAMPDIGNEAIVNGDLKKTLALIFFIMLKYQIHLIIADHGEDFISSLSELSERERDDLLHHPKDTLPSDTPPDTPLTPPSKAAQPTPNNATSLFASRKMGSSHSIADKAHGSTAAEAKVALLFWVRIQLEDYIAANIIPSVQDFSRSWRSGLAFCLLIHRHDPILIPDLFTTHMKADFSEKQTWHTLLTMAFNLAASHLGIPSYLDPEDLIEVEHPHEPSIMMYVSEYYKLMSRTQREDTEETKREKKIRRRANIAMAMGGEIESISASPPPIEEQSDDDDDDGDTEETEQEDISSFLLQSKLAAEAPSSPIQTNQTLLEAPVPVPMPSARRRKMAHRKSTLPEEDKARIKADLNSRLRMQLTGHLPRGVHPLLDQLLTINETMMSFIKTNTRTIDDIPEEFVASTAVSEYIDALEIIEEQIESEAGHLDIAKEAKDTLTSPPETADDTLIRLTDLQRAQVEKLYEVLLKEWNDFTEFLRSTKLDLLRVESDLVATEEDASKFQHEASIVSDVIDQLEQTLRNVPPKTDDNNPLHPLDGTQEIAELFERDVVQAKEIVESFDRTTWKQFKSFARQFSPAVLHVVSIQHSELQSKYDGLMVLMKEIRKASVNFRSALAFAVGIHSIDEQLEAVQAIMDSNEKATTDDAIQHLEDRVAAVRSKIHRLQEEYHDLLSLEGETGARFVESFKNMEKRYETVRDWVDQVRVWFIEAERIREWIESRIKTIEDRNKEHTFDPLSAIVDVAEKVAKQLDEEHKRLKRNIEQFNADDMARLRSHVKTLTMEKRGHELSPADTSTIEITLTTLNLLSKLMKLMQARSLLVDMLTLRFKWEGSFSKASEWIADTDQEIDVFLHSKARWVQKMESEDKKSVEDVIQSLVALEKKIAAFDQELYSEVLDAYQEMEDLNEMKLPEHLETRQTNFEQSFEALMKRCAFSRKVVEQRLAMTEAVSQFIQLRDKGERLKQIMMEAEGNVTEKNDEDLYGERVQEFKEQSSQLMTDVTANIPYPSLSEDTAAMIENDAANESIRHAINSYGMALAVIAETLEELLVSHRQTLSLQQRASLAYDEVLRMTTWMDEKARAMTKQLDVFDEERLVFDEESIKRLEKERESVAARFKQMKDGDLARLLEQVRLIESEIDSTNAVSLDRGMLVSGIESLEHSQEKLKRALERRVVEIDIMTKYQAWDLERAAMHQKVTVATRDIWQFIANKAQYDPIRENVEIPVLSEEANHAETLQYLEIQDSEYLAVDHCYDELVKAYNTLDSRADVVPSVVTIKHTELKKSGADIHQLCHYASQLLTQRTIVLRFLSQSQKVEKEGETIRDELTKVQRDANNDRKSLDDRFTAFKSQVNEVCNEYGNAVPYPVCGNLTCPEQPEEVGCNPQIKALIDRRMDELRILEEAIERSYSSYMDTNQRKDLINQCETEAILLQKWMDERFEIMKLLHINVASESFAAISEHHLLDLQKEQTRITTELEEFESIKVQKLREDVAKIKAKLGQWSSSIDISATEKALERVLINLERLKKIVHDQSLSLDAANKRTVWESKISDGMSCLEEMNDALREFTTRKNKAFSHANLSEEVLATLLDDLSELDRQHIEFTKLNMGVIKNCYLDLTESFSKLSRPIVTPEHMEARMESLTQSHSRLQENISARSKELSLVKQKFQWEVAIRDALLALSSQDSRIDEFVKIKARWSPDVEMKDNDAQQLRDECVLLFNGFTAYMEGMAKKIKDEHHNIRAALSGYGMHSILETLSKQLQDLSNAELRVQEHLEYADNVVTQRCSVSAFILRTDELERLAEAIRDEFLTSKDDLEGQAEQLLKFKAGVDDVRDLGNAVPYPVRSAEGISMQAKVKDDSTNSVIRDTIDMCNTKLAEYSSSLQRLLESKETITRRQMMLQSYHTHADACDAWIRSRKEKLRQNAEMLDSIQSLDITRLKDAVSGTDSIDTAMRARFNIYISLQITYEKCESAFSDNTVIDEEQGLVHEFTEVVATQKRIAQEWSDLLEESARVSRALSALLVPAECVTKIQKLLAAFQGIQAQVDTADASAITDDQILTWQKEIDRLETKEYNGLQSEVTTSLQALSPNMIADAMSELDQIGDIIPCIRTSLTQLYDTVNLNRLRKTYLESSAVAIKAIDRLHSSFADIRQRFDPVSSESPEARAMQHQKLIAAHRAVKKQMCDGKETYSDLCSYYDFTQVHGKDSDIDQTHADIQKRWKELETEGTSLSGFVFRAAKWVDCYEILDSIQAELSLIESDMQKLNGTRVVNSGPLDDIEKKLRKISFALDEVDAATNSDDMIADQSNQASFSKQRSCTVSLLEEQQSALGVHRQNLERTTLAQSYSTETKRLCGVCEEQLTFIRQQAISNPDLAGKKADAIKNIVKAYGAAVANTRDVYRRCKDEFDGTLNEQADKLTNVLNHPKMEVDRIRRPLEKLLGDLDTAITTEDEYLKTLRAVIRHAQLESHVNRALNDFKVLVTRYSKSTMTRSKSNLLPDLSEFRRRYDSVEESLNNFYVVGNELKGNLQKSIGVARMATVTRTVDRRHDTVKQRWTEIKVIADETKARLEELQKRLTATTKLSDVLWFVGDMKDRVNAFQFTGKSFAVEEQELKELKEEIETTLVKKTKEVDAIMVDVPDQDGSLKKQRTQLSAVIEELHQLVQTKEQLAYTEGNITEFLSLVDEVDSQINQMATTIEKSAPHHAAIVNNRFNKADLQAMLKALIATYKDNEPKINDLLDKAKLEAQKQFLDDNERVANRLAKTMDRWNKIQTAAIAREKELQLCIKKLNHEFFTKLAMAKSSTPRIRTGNKSTTPTTVTPPKRPSIYRQAVASPLGSRRSSVKSASAVTDNRAATAAAANVRRSKTPTLFSSKPLSAYVPDPKNELDVQLSRIVNESPFRMKVKMVPNEAGKYWFGDEHPRLVYCRILPSKVVMVRVGGGWVELARFLRDHGGETSDSSESTSGRSSRNANYDNQELSHAFSRSRASSGYMDGDHFVQTDSEGKQIAMKMVKAGNNAKVPSRKKSS
ncbi:Spectrin beta chain, non-erythrocytic 1 [Apophysomyces ossiformis]|uniref:Spectrin beta chain, non-erythrocytic 1 n=1 Tax=Apophysomyces ossiformis TaxID=679940 RepID=A0A8H7BJP7_9FUNG|nr:Spectrin beta chain, non-erythrocytic 1 [Apophysomyces ossiformis]